MADKLGKYRRKRDFSTTDEPSGKENPSQGKNIFVIQKHDASSLHYDFRIKIGKTLKSWAVPKGPSTDPSEKRLAVPTEDHPIDYADFEGVIPEAEYGAGVVMVWDRGTFENIRDISMEQSYEDGKIEVFLEGEKLSGGYSLIKTGKRWLLVKMDDEQADARRNPTSTENRSVKTGRTLDEIREDEGDG
jgi:DNA ligase D-like protein (predicted 3'-phosphoesterase)